jgi:SAM-dependent methyltransferase
MNASAAYAKEFFDLHEHGVVRSAQVIVPILTGLIKPTSVIDVGCGRGAWLRAFQHEGAATILGLDGEYVKASQLMIPPACFRCVDMNEPFELPGRYDLAVCLEVAEHLPEKMAAVLVDRLVQAAPVILFSAALPGQGGTHHLNEQMPAYWRALFKRHGYALLDPIRPLVLTDSRIDHWYRQNTVVYASEDAIRKRPALDAYRVAEDGLGIEWVQAYLLAYYDSPRNLCRQLPGAVVRACRRRIARLAGIFRVSPPPKSP